METKHCDFLVVGSGLAGLSFALKAAEHGRVFLICKEQLKNTNTFMAQGGIASVTDQEDSFADHIQDTLTAGAGLCHLDVVQNFIEQAPARIEDLQKWGVNFDTNSIGQTSGPSLHKEGGHSYRRILHYEDQTGMAIQNALTTKVLSHPNIQVFEYQFAIDLILNKHLQAFSVENKKVLGAYCLNLKKGCVEAFIGKVTVLATGGSGKVYLYTSNWSGATGDGIAMGSRAGARVANMEFTQFHPTCLYHPMARNFLISEALRGEGGELINSSGKAFMKGQHPLGSLAPRDIVARLIDAEMKQTGAACVYLDMTHLGGVELQQKFPAIYKKCAEYGIYLEKDPIPVVPAAHYQCGGILTDVNGQTDLAGLYAIGEVACTGLHGANRLASNSLLECLASSHNAIEKILAQGEHKGANQLIPPAWVEPTLRDDDELVVISHMWDEIRRLMWNYVGIVRSNKRLKRAEQRLINIQNEVREYYSDLKLSRDILELRNISLVARLIVVSALKRKESRGIHYSLDYPESFEDPKIITDTILHKQYFK